MAIARALVQTPRVLLLDEPLSNLDARLRLHIREEIRRLVKGTGITTIFVTHDQEEALSISDRIVLMDEGVVQQYDNPQKLYLDPANLFVAQFMGSPIINIFDMRFDRSDGMLRGKAFDIALADLDGSRFRADAAGGMLTEERYKVGIRPEYFLTEPVKGHADGFKPAFEAEIESLEMIGRYAVLHFDAGGQHARSVVDARTGIRQGQRVAFAIGYDDIYLFSEDGTRVY